MKKYIYTNDITRNIWTEHPMINFPDTSHTYVSLEVLKEVLSKNEFRELQLKVRKHRVQTQSLQFNDRTSVDCQETGDIGSNPVKFTMQEELGVEANYLGRTRDYLLVRKKLIQQQ